MVEVSLLQHDPWLLWEELSIHHWGVDEGPKALYSLVNVVEFGDVLYVFLCLYKLNK